MTARSELLEMQREQRRHDQEYHPDVYYLPYESRARHLALHLAKYTGRIAEWGTVDDAGERLPTTLADSFIVTLSFSEILKLDLNQELLRTHPEAACQTVGDWMTFLATMKGPQDETLVIDWWLRRMATSSGTLGKALESLDHIEPVDTRRLLALGVMEVLTTCLIVAGHVRVDLKALVQQRWRDIEANRIF